jgi:hypothetical protein
MSKRSIGVKGFRYMHCKMEISSQKIIKKMKTKRKSWNKKGREEKKRN